MPRVRARFDRGEATARPSRRHRTTQPRPRCERASRMTAGRARHVLPERPRGAGTLRDVEAPRRILLMRRLLTLLFALSLGASAPLSNGCTGMTLGENGPGRDTYLEDGSIAVDPVTETAYVLRRTDVTHEEADGTTWRETFKHLYRVSPDDAGAHLLADVSDLDDLRMLFPRDQVL